jgi:hypothetical protein
VSLLKVAAIHSRDVLGTLRELETEEELDAAIEGLRAEIARLIDEGKKVLVQ